MKVDGYTPFSSSLESNAPYISSNGSSQKRSLTQEEDTEDVDASCSKRQRSLQEQPDQGSFGLVHLHEAGLTETADNEDLMSMLADEELQAIYDAASNLHLGSQTNPIELDPDPEPSSSTKPAVLSPAPDKDCRQKLTSQEIPTPDRSNPFEGI